MDVREINIENEINEPRGSSSRLARCLRVVASNCGNASKGIRTRTLSEMIFTSPRNHSRVTPRNNRFEMDIELSSAFVNGDGMTLSWMNPVERRSSMSSNSSMGTGEMDEPEEESTTLCNQDGVNSARNVASVVDVLFEIHSALKGKHLGQRTAASALAASNLVSSVAYPKDQNRDVENEALENARRMLECLICQDIYTEATEATCCGQMYCRSCIERWMHERGSCPMCRVDITFSMLVGSRHTQRMADEMMVSCQWCDVELKKGALDGHIKDCKKAPIPPPPPADLMVRKMLFQNARLSIANMRLFLGSPAPPQAEMIQCYIRLDGDTYQLYAQEGDQLLCKAVRRRRRNLSMTFSISVAEESITGNNTESSSNSVELARLDRNFVGSQYTLFGGTTVLTDGVVGVDMSAEVGAVQYEPTYGRTPREMRVAVPIVNSVGSVSDDPSDLPIQQWVHQPLEVTGTDDSLRQQIERTDGSRAVSLVNKPPVWIESLDAYCLDFGGRVAVASVKNFILASPANMEETTMLFGRTADRNVFAMDYRHPLSPLQAFSIALSSMDSHLISFD